MKNRKTDDLIPTYDEDGNIIETDGREYIDGKEYRVIGNSGNTIGVYEEEKVEVDEVIGRIVTYRICVLHLKEMGRYV